MTHCLNCGTDFEGNYCPECGQKAKTQRLSISNILEGIVSLLFSRDSKSVRTCKDLVLRPGIVARDFILGHRGRYNAPMPLLVALVALYSIAVHFMPDAASPFSSFEIQVTTTTTTTITSDDEEDAQEVQEAPNTDSTVEKSITSIWDPDIFEYCSLDTIVLLGIQEILGNIVYHVVLSSLLCAFPYWLVFRRRKLLRQDGQLLPMNMAEHFFALFYLSAISLMVAFVALPLNFVPGWHDGLNTIMGLVPSVICIALYRQMLGLSWGRSLWLNILASLLTLALIALLLFLFVAPTVLFDEGGSFELV